VTASIVMCLCPTQSVYYVVLHIQPGKVRTYTDRRMEIIQVEVCVHCAGLLSKATVPTTIQHWTSLETLQISSRSCHCCLILYSILAQRSSEAQVRFGFSTWELDRFPLTTTSVACQNTVEGICSKTVTVALGLPNKFTYTSDLTIASCPSRCEMAPVLHHL
jgi:hypothetical protein